MFKLAKSFFVIGEFQVLAIVNLVLLDQLNQSDLDFLHSSVVFLVSLSVLFPAYKLGLQEQK